MVHMNTRTLALGLSGVGATVLVGWLLVSGAKPPHAQSAAVAAAPTTVGQGTPAMGQGSPTQGSSQVTPAPQMAVASAPSSTPTPPATTAAKKPQVKYAQNPKAKKAVRKVKRRANIRRD
jgi:hypothetical protein